MMVKNEGVSMQLWYVVVSDVVVARCGDGEYVGDEDDGDEGDDYDDVVDDDNDDDNDNEITPVSMEILR